MDTQKDLLDRVMEKVVLQVVEGLKDTIARTVEKELSSNLSRALVESEFYRRISEEMRGGLQNIYKQIAEATRPSGAPAADQPEQADKLFLEASRQLDEILDTTEQATTEIMDVVEKHMALQNRSQELLAALRKTRKSNPAIQQLIDINEELGENLMTIMTSLSFQDLTGQRIKKIINALKTIEGIVFDLYLSTGLSIKAREEAPDKDTETIRQESTRKVHELKGPQVNGPTQADIDDLLNQLL